MLALMGFSCSSRYYLFFLHLRCHRSVIAGRVSLCPSLTRCSPCDGRPRWSGIQSLCRPKNRQPYQTGPGLAFIRSAGMSLITESFYRALPNHPLSGLVSLSSQRCCRNHLLFHLSPDLSVVHRVDACVPRCHPSPSCVSTVGSDR